MYYNTFIVEASNFTLTPEMVVQPFLGYPSCIIPTGHMLFPSLSKLFYVDSMQYISFQVNGTFNVTGSWNLSGIQISNLHNKYIIHF